MERLEANPPASALGVLRSHNDGNPGLDAARSQSREPHGGASMKTLVLMRHAKAVREWQADHDRNRGLTDRGREEAMRTAAALAALGVRPDVTLHSPAARTRETWDIAREVLPAAATACVESLYLAPAEELARVAAEAGGDVTLVIAHNPGVKDLARWYVSEGGAHDAAGQAHLADGFPTGCAAVFAVGDSLARGRLRLTAFVHPDQAAPPKTA